MKLFTFCLRKQSLEKEKVFWLVSQLGFFQVAFCLCNLTAILDLFDEH